MGTPKKIMVCGLAALVSGIVLAMPLGYFWLMQRSTRVMPAARFVVPAAAPQPSSQPDLITGKPNGIRIPSLNIDLTVADGVYDTKTATWTLSKDKVHYAVPSVQPNNKQGNTLIYGHYRKGVLASLHKIARGAELIVHTENGHTFTYSYRESQIVDPGNIDIFAYAGKPQLTLQTCTGLWMQNRQLFFFELVTAT